MTKAQWHIARILAATTVEQAEQRLREATRDLPKQERTFATAYQRWRAQRGLAEAD